MTIPMLKDQLRVYKTVRKDAELATLKWKDVPLKADLIAAVLAALTRLERYECLLTLSELP